MTTKMKKLMVVVAMAAAVNAADGGTPTLPETEDLVEFVDPMIGTVGTGHVFPGPCRPFGLVQPSPDTGNVSWRYCSGYAGDDRAIRRFSQTHLNGTGQAGLGDIAFQPFTGELPAADVAAPFDKRDEEARLGSYAVRLADGTRVEIAAGRRLAHYRITFPAGKPCGILLDFPYGLYREKGYAPHLTTACDARQVAPGRFESLSHSEIFAPRDIASVVAFTPAPTSVRELPRAAGDKGPRYAMRFAPGARVEVKIALSARSVEGARRNFAAEGTTDFDTRVAETRAAWAKLLARFDASGLSRDEKVAAYTSLYHLCVQPNLISDVGEKPRYSTFSLWDTFRDAHPLYETLVPELVPDFVNSLLDHYDRWGYLSRWELWGRETNCMIGAHAVSVIVSAYLHGFRGFDVEKAYAAVRASLTNEARPGAGKIYPRRTEWSLYEKYGYFPFDLVPRESVSRTLECAYDDSCAAAFARALGKTDDADYFERRSWNFTNLFDRATLCFRGRDSKGRWRTPFAPAAASTPDFTEGSALQFSWFVPHRIDWLVAAMGGRDTFAKRLDAFFAGTIDPETPRHYGQDITGLIGDYSHGNEPCHHIVDLYRHVGQGEKADALTRRIIREFYKPRPDGLCGNDDCGQMSAWLLRRIRCGK